MSPKFFKEFKWFDKTNKRFAGRHENCRVAMHITITNDNYWFNLNNFRIDNSYKKAVL